MTDKFWLGSLQSILAGSDDETNRAEFWEDEFWKRLSNETKTPNLDYFKQLSRQEQPIFRQLRKDLWDLKQNQLDNEQRQVVYKRLAKRYDCIFRSMEESEPGGHGGIANTSVSKE
jgi:hypothetical protein